MAQELLPCPFCGGSDLSHGWSSPGYDGSMHSGSVECHECGALIIAGTEAEAIAAWNTRARPGNWQETVNELARLEADNAALRADVERLRKSFCEVQHSIEQARIPGNDWRRELILIENITRAALTERKP